MAAAKAHRVVVVAQPTTCARPIKRRPTLDQRSPPHRPPTLLRPRGQGGPTHPYARMSPPSYLPKRGSTRTIYPSPGGRTPSRRAAASALNSARDNPPRNCFDVGRAVEEASEPAEDDPPAPRSRRRTRPRYNTWVLVFESPPPLRRAQTVVLACVPWGFRAGRGVVVWCRRAPPRFFQACETARWFVPGYPGCTWTKDRRT